MKNIIIITLLFIVATSKGQDKIAWFYDSEKIDDTVLTLYSDNKYRITFYFASDLPDFRTEDDDKILSEGNWTQKSDTIILVEMSKKKQSVNKTFKLLKVGENTLKNLTVEFFVKNEMLRMYGFTNITKNWTFIGKIKFGLMNGEKINLKTKTRYIITNGVVTDSIKRK